MRTEDRGRILRLTPRPIDFLAPRSSFACTSTFRSRPHLTIFPEMQSVLLIEDDPDVSSAVERVLGSAGYAVQSARDGQSGLRLELTQKEYALLEFLVRHAGQPVSRSKIAEQVWKYEVDPATNVVDVYINYLRKKLGDEKRRPLIRTVRGVGYMIN